MSDNNTKLNYKKSIKPKDYHPMLPYCQDVFQAAGSTYIQQLMDHLVKLIEDERDHHGIDPEENDNGIILETLRMATEGEKLNDRYVMGATLFVIHSLIPVKQVIEKTLQERYAEADESNEEESEE